MSTNRTTYKIRQVVELTGASEFLLRVWENRYSAFNPIRTKTGRRLYSDNDVLKARALVRLTEQGSRIGDIAKMSLTELTQLMNQNSELSNQSDTFAKSLLTKANQYQWQEIRELLQKRKQKNKPLDWIQNVIVPLLIEMSHQADAGLFSIAQEHILSAIIKEQLTFHDKKKIKKQKNGPRMVIAAPEGDFHDIGLLIANRIAAELNIETLYLGSHMPKDELAAVCVRYKATHLLISSTSEKSDGAKDDYLNFLNFLDRNIDQKVHFWLAGRNSIKYPVQLSRSNLILKDFKQFESELKKYTKKLES